MRIQAELEGFWEEDKECMVRVFTEDDAARRHGGIRLQLLSRESESEPYGLLYETSVNAKELATAIASVMGWSENVEGTETSNTP